MFLTKTGKPKLPPENAKNIKRTKHKCGDMETNRVNEQRIAEMSGVINTLISNYYTQPGIVH